MSPKSWNQITSLVPNLACTSSSSSSRMGTSSNFLQSKINRQHANRMARLPAIMASIIIIGLIATTGAIVDGVHGASIHADESSKSINKEEPQLSAADGLVKRSAPFGAPSSPLYSHSIMRFGRAPHNIMHFGKRANGHGNGQISIASNENVENLPQSSWENAIDSDIPESAFSPQSSSSIYSYETAAAPNSMATADWQLLLLNNLLSQQQQQQQQFPTASMRQNNKNSIRYLLVPIRVSSDSTGSVAGYDSNNVAPHHNNRYILPSSSSLAYAMPPIKKASSKLSDESDNVFMHFG